MRAPASVRSWMDLVCLLSMGSPVELVVCERTATRMLNALRKMLASAVTAVKSVGVTRCVWSHAREDRSDVDTNDIARSGTTSRARCETPCGGPVDNHQSARARRRSAGFNERGVRAPRLRAVVPPRARPSAAARSSGRPRGRVAPSVRTSARALGDSHRGRD